MSLLDNNFGYRPITIESIESIGFKLSKNTVYHVNGRQANLYKRFSKGWVQEYCFETAVLTIYPNDYWRATKERHSSVPEFFEDIIATLGQYECIG